MARDINDIKGIDVANALEACGVSRGQELIMRTLPKDFETQLWQWVADGAPSDKVPQRAKDYRGGEVR